MKEGWTPRFDESDPHYIRASRPICGARFVYKGRFHNKPTGPCCINCWRILEKEKRIPAAPPPTPVPSIMNHSSLRVTMRFNPIELASLDGICKFHAMSQRFIGGAADSKLVAAETRAICIRINQAYARAKQKLDQAIKTTRKAMPTAPPLQHSTTPLPPKAS